jgi:DNA-directed RNA polymerase subunit M
MIFCPKCGSLLVPKGEGNRKVLACSSCSYKTYETKQAVIREEIVQKQPAVDIIEKEIETLPLIEAECPKCGHKKAYFWTIQTRAADEPETKFFKCEKCKHTWRDYN